ncbi:hypothetical protein AGDE_02463 [Angomonas deanei]|nr:hypothetical protein AGDE_02463 [Angomonas deanei]|eukprot:EPY41461.1 hypothetical protein AGDE_02463 [Angomonas deanei]
MVQLTPSLERSVSGCVGGLLVSSVSGLAVAPTDIAVPPNLLTALGISGQALLSILNMNPILIRMISDTMCTYSVILPTSSI